MGSVYEVLSLMSEMLGKRGENRDAKISFMGCVLCALNTASFYEWMSKKSSCGTTGKFK